MVQELLQEIDLSDLGLALKICSPELVEFFHKNVSTNMEAEIDDIFKGKPQSLSRVNEATDRIMEVVRLKVTKGQLIINKNGEEEYV